MCYTCKESCILLIYISVFVRLPMGAVLYLETNPLFTIEHVKSMIVDKKGIPTNAIRLEFAEQQLEDRRKLIDYSIQDGATLSLVAPSKCMGQYVRFFACMCSAYRHNFLRML